MTIAAVPGTATGHTARPATSYAAIPDDFEKGTRGGAIAPAREELGFSDLLDVINPLQHIPGVSTIYRSLTGDTIKPVARVAGGLLYGGPAAALTAGVMAGVEEAVVGGAASQAETAAAAPVSLAAASAGTAPVTAAAEISAAATAPAAARTLSAVSSSAVSSSAASSSAASSSAIPSAAAASSRATTSAARTGSSILAGKAPSATPTLPAAATSQLAAAPSDAAGLQAGRSGATGKDIRAYIVQSMPGRATTMPVTPVSTAVPPAALRMPTAPAAEKASAAPAPAGSAPMSSGPMPAGPKAAPTPAELSFADRMLSGLAKYRAMQATTGSDQKSDG